MKLKILAFFVILLLSTNISFAGDANSANTNLNNGNGKNKEVLKPTLPAPPKKKLKAFGWHKTMDADAKSLCHKMYPDSKKDYGRCVKRKTREKQKR